VLASKSQHTTYIHTFDHKNEMWCYNILLDSIHIESTDGNFVTHEKVAIPIVTCTFPIVIPMFGLFVFTYPWDSNGNPVWMGILFLCSSLSNMFLQYDALCWGFISSNVSGSGYM